jgi:hypothetical protein
MKTWVSEGGISYHSLIVFQSLPGESSPPMSFKFNSTSLQQEYYKQLISTLWSHHNPSFPNSAMKQFVDNLAKAKTTSRKWAKEFREKPLHQQKDVESKISTLYEEKFYVQWSFKQLSQLQNLEVAQHSLLSNEAKNWQLKGQAIWIQEGDNNIEFFHNYAKM